MAPLSSFSQRNLGNNSTPLFLLFFLLGSPWSNFLCLRFFFSADSSVIVCVCMRWFDFPVFCVSFSLELCFHKSTVSLCLLLFLWLAFINSFCYFSHLFVFFGKFSASQGIKDLLRSLLTIPLFFVFGLSTDSLFFLLFSTQILFMSLLNKSVIPDASMMWFSKI